MPRDMLQNLKAVETVKTTLVPFAEIIVCLDIPQFCSRIECISKVF